jgi:hypothetical protein
VTDGRCRLRAWPSFCIVPSVTRVFQMVERAFQHGDSRTRAPRNEMVGRASPFISRSLRTLARVVTLQPGLRFERRFTVFADAARLTPAVTARHPK